MLQPIKFANAVTVVFVVLQIIYLLLVAVAPGLVYFYMGSMVPGYNFSAIESKDDINWGFALFGVILMAVSAWVLTYAVIWLYNRLTK